MRLLKVLLAERGLQPEFKPLPDYDFTTVPDYLMLIGDSALDFLFGGHEHDIWDLGTAWYELTGLPFVYAVCALRRGIENTQLRRQLTEVYSASTPSTRSSATTRNTTISADYLGWHIHYHLARRERGLAKFAEPRARARPDEPRFVS